MIVDFFILCLLTVIVYVGVWHYHLSAELEPYVHYVPCDEVSELEARVTWVFEHTEEAARIAANAHALFRRAATPEHAKRCVARTLARLADPREAAQCVPAAQ